MSDRTDPGEFRKPASDLVATTACPAFRIDLEGKILEWNVAAEALFGRPRDNAVGRRCHDVVAGRDLFGNRFCDGSCSVRNMARRGEPVHHFLMDVRQAGGESVRTGCCTLVESVGDETNILHVFQVQDETTTEHGVGGGEGASGQEASRDEGFLTPREREVLMLLDRGEATREIASRLGISVTTVRNHIQGILRKLGAHSRLEAVSVARRDGLL